MRTNFIFPFAAISIVSLLYISNFVNQRVKLEIEISNLSNREICDAVNFKKHLNTLSEKNCMLMKQEKEGYLAQL